MAAEITPEEIRRAEFRTVLRGLDSGQVAAFLDRLAAELERLAADRDRLTERLGEWADRDLATEFENVGREVAAVLQSAREAAESMRERASADSARWRSEAMAEVEQMRKEARSDAEALRGDAWATGSEMLNQAAAEARRIRAEAERDVLTVMGEAEREAHRLVSTARREAEDLLRAAKMEAEKQASEGRKHHDELIEQAHRQAESAQERTRALEERRQELMAELETVRSTLARLEGTLEERREALDLSSDSTSVRVVPALKHDPDPQNWALGETVRVIPPASPPPPRSRPQPGVRRESVSRPEPEPLPEPEPRPEPEPQPVPEPEPEPRPETEPEPEGRSEVAPEEAEPALEPGKQPVETKPVPGDEVSALFASLRGGPDDGGDEAPPRPAAEEAVSGPIASPDPSPVAQQPAVATTDRADLIEERDASLLPITNRALRGVKKAVTDVQNLALDRLRTEGDWEPDPADLAEMLRADLIGLWAESYSAGHAAAEAATGTRLKRGDTPPSSAADGFGADLAEAVGKALVDAGEGPRERQAAVSRVFRGWRTDEAERRVRQLALHGYHRGVVEAGGGASTVTWVANGTPCSACRQAAADPAAHLPPVHPGCECTVTVA